MAWRNDIISRLSDQSVGTFGVSLFASSKAVIPMLPSGLATVHVRDETGAPPELTHNVNGPAYENVSAVLITRADTYAAAESKARAARTALFLWNVTINGTWYREIVPINEVHDIGPDERSDQARASFTIRGVRRP